MSDDRLTIGMTCYPTYGGSGVLATELALELGRRGHRVHVIAYDVPVRLDRSAPNVWFHAVDLQEYPLFPQHGTYAVALASRMVEVATWEGLDLLHVHYAVPHATSAWLAREILGEGAPKLVTTLHGTDITLVGADPTYLPVTRFSIQRSQAVTVPSEFLRRATYERLGVPEDVALEVIPNFVDTAVWTPATPRDPTCLKPLFAHRAGPPCPGGPVLFHVSNFRPVKRIGDVVAIFERVARRSPARLILVGDGPDRPRAECQLRELGLADRVAFLGRQEHFAEHLRHGHVLLLPSETESFGLAALEAMSCGVPVVGSDVGGLPEVVRPGETGFLAPVGDVDAMAEHVLRLLEDAALHERMAVRAREDVLARFRIGALVDRYEAVYRRVLAR